MKTHHRANKETAKKLIVPKAQQKRVAELSKASDMAELAVACNRAKFDQAIKAGDIALAYDCKRVQQPKLLKASRAADDALWNALKELFPEVKDGDDCWSLDIDDMVVVPHDHSHGGGMLSSLASMMGRN